MFWGVRELKTPVEIDVLPGYRGDMLKQRNLSSVTFLFLKSQQV
jgi:hypothetical protein